VLRQQRGSHGAANSAHSLPQLTADCTDAAARDCFYCWQLSAECRRVPVPVSTQSRHISCSSATLRDEMSDSRNH